jgi:hypothetical protein
LPRASSWRVLSGALNAAGAWRARGGFALGSSAGVDTPVTSASRSTEATPRTLSGIVNNIYFQYYGL